MDKEQIGRRALIVALVILSASLLFGLIRLGGIMNDRSPLIVKYV
jgi:hypothetical protein